MIDTPPCLGISRKIAAWLSLFMVSIFISSLRKNPILLYISTYPYVSNSEGSSNETAPPSIMDDLLKVFVPCFVHVKLVMIRTNLCVKYSSTNCIVSSDSRPEAQEHKTSSRYEVPNICISILCTYVS